MLSIATRNNVHVHGKGSKTMVLAHGFGCDQNMWRFLVPIFSDEYRIVLFDLVGSGLSEISAYDPGKYKTLTGYADDLIEIIQEFSEDPVVFVGQSVSAIIGLLATIKSPECFAANIMVGPSPSYINDGDYIGGFDKEDIDELITAVEENYLGWSSAITPAIMGSSAHPDLTEDLTNSFCRTDPVIAKHFAKVTFLSDHRGDISKSFVPSLIIQCHDDFIAPIQVGEYMQRMMPNAKLEIIENIGHCPHMSSPEKTAAAIKSFLVQLI
jgi:sigma-B regulation protein RsbQ